MNNFFSNMYGNTRQTSKTSPENDREKRAVKVLGGMKVHGSHQKQIDVNGELLNVPKIEYVMLLDGQIKEVRQKLRDAEQKILRLQSNQRRLIDELRSLKQESMKRSVR